MTIDIVIPTWNREVKLARCLRSIEAQTYKNIRVHPIVDHEHLFAFGVWNRFLETWNDGDAFVYVCDDTELDPGCIEAAVAALGRFNNDALISFRQSNIEKDKSTWQLGISLWCLGAMGMMGRAFVDRFPGRMAFCPDYSRFYADPHLADYAQWAERFEHCHDASLIHHHPSHEKAEWDATHDLVRDKREIEIDKANDAERKSRGWLWGRDFNLLGRGK